MKNNFSDFKRSRLRLESFLVIQEISLQGSNSSSSSNTSCLLHWKNRFCKHWTLGLYSHGWTLAKGHFISSSFELRKLYTQSQFSVRKEEEEEERKKFRLEKFSAENWSWTWRSPKWSLRAPVFDVVVVVVVVDVGAKGLAGVVLTRTEWDQLMQLWVRRLREGERDRTFPTNTPWISALWHEICFQWSGFN